MPIHLRARAAYGTFREQYRGDERNRDKITANLELVVRLIHIFSSIINSILLTLRGNENTNNIVIILN